MANNPSRFGFKWHSAMQGTPHPKPQRMRVASGLASVVNPGSVACDLNVGDPVKYVSTGTVAMCASDEAVYGIVEGFSAIYLNGNTFPLPYLDKLPTGTTYVAGEAQIFVHVVPVAGQIFEAVCDDATTATTEAAYNAFINENVTYVYVPDATSKQARAVLDISTHAVTATLGWRILDTSRRIDVDYSGLYVPLLVSCNKVQQTPYVLDGV